MIDILFTILIVILVLVLFVLAFALLRTVTFARPIEPVAPAGDSPLDASVIAEHLSTVLRCKTISTDTKNPTERKAFFEMHRIIEKLYPRVHASLKREIVQEFSLLYTWTGSRPELEPVLFIAHMDVVPADPDKWDYPPFSGQVADGFVWGRGALDIKNQLVAVLETVEGLLRAGYQPERTVLLGFGHDEELSGAQGAAQIAAYLESQGLHLAALIDEGGAVVQGNIPGVSVPVAMVGVAEKGYLSLELKVQGLPGHSSVPPAHSSIGILARALERLEAHPMPVDLSPVQPMFRAIGSAAPFYMQAAFANTWLLGGILRRAMLNTPTTAATVRTTTAVTMVQGGIKDNVMPSEARALVNFRLIPGDTIANLCERVRKIVADERVAFEPYDSGAWEASPVSEIDTPVYTVLERTIRQVFGTIPVAPYLVIGATDSRHYTAICDHVYRFSPVEMTPADLNRMHGINERISVDALAKMTQFFTLLMEAWSKAEM